MIDRRLRPSAKPKPRPWRLLSAPRSASGRVWTPLTIFNSTTATPTRFVDRCIASKQPRRRSSARCRSRCPELVVMRQPASHPDGLCGHHRTGSELGRPTPGHDTLRFGGQMERRSEAVLIAGLPLDDVAVETGRVSPAPAKGKRPEDDFKGRPVRPTRYQSD